MAMNPYQKYQQQSVMTMTRGEMLTKLYDEILKQLNASMAFIEQREYEAVNNALKKAQRILGHLITTLDSDYAISDQLSALYEYFIHQLIQGNLAKDPKPIQEVLLMVRELRDTFVQADRSARVGEIAG